MISIFDKNIQSLNHEEIIETFKQIDPSLTDSKIREFAHIAKRISSKYESLNQDYNDKIIDNPLFRIKALKMLQASFVVPAQKEVVEEKQQVENVSAQTIDDEFETFKSYILNNIDVGEKFSTSGLYLKGNVGKGKKADTRKTIGKRYMAKLQRQKIIEQLHDPAAERQKFWKRIA